MSINFNQVNVYNFNGSVPSFAPPMNQANQVRDILADLFQSFADLFNSMGSNQFNNSSNIPSCGCTSPPNFTESSHPSGSLKTDGNVVTTPGGYQIEPLSKFEWKITGPDGKTTRVWGDPHVAEGDGGKWDFKRNSTFVLGDGTRINVTTAPWKNGKMTVTSQLEIISGNDRVMVTDIDKGRGKIGQVTQDGYQHVNSFGGNDVFVMGRESDDWSHQGREIIGSNNGGESFKLGNYLAAGNTNALTTNSNKFMNASDMILRFVEELIGGWQDNWRPNNFGSNPYTNDLFNRPSYDRTQHQEQMRDVFRALSNMFDALARLASLNDTVFAMRNRTAFV